VQKKGLDIQLSPTESRRPISLDGHQLLEHSQKRESSAGDTLPYPKKRWELVEETMAQDSGEKVIPLFSLLACVETQARKNQGRNSSNSKGRRVAKKTSLSSANLGVECQK